MRLLLAIALCLGPPLWAKEIALSFDDAPKPSSPHYSSQHRANELIRKLRELEVPPVLFFANACAGKDRAQALKILRRYREAGHLIGNHTCSHVQLTKVGLPAFVRDVEQGEKLFPQVGQKFFRFPYLDEGAPALRDAAREWLAAHHFRNAPISIPSADYVFSEKLSQSIARGENIDYEKVGSIFVEHILDSVARYDELAKKVVGRSPRQVLILHEMDATVLFLEPLVKALRKKGWTLIPTAEAYQDEIYRQAPKNFNAGNGILSHLAAEKGIAQPYFSQAALRRKLNALLGLTPHPPLKAFE